MQVNIPYRDAMGLFDAWKQFQNTFSQMVVTNCDLPIMDSEKKKKQKT